MIMFRILVTRREYSDLSSCHCSYFYTNINTNVLEFVILFKNAEIVTYFFCGEVSFVSPAPNPQPPEPVRDCMLNAFVSTLEVAICHGDSHAKILGI
jgi:hypothetical protein